METLADFGARVRAALSQHGHTIRSAARALSYDHAYLSRVLAGKQQPSTELVAALDQLLGAEGGIAELHTVLTEDDRDRIGHSLTYPSRLDAATVTSLAEVLAAQRRLDDTLGAVPMIGPTQAQAATARDLLRGARGPHRDALAEVVAEFVQFEGWLHAEARRDGRALVLLDEALQLADEADVAELRAQARNFRGYVARQRRDLQGVVRWFGAAYRTPGAHPAQRMGDAAQTAQGLALMGEHDQARRILDEATSLGDAARANTPPGTAYWLSPAFQHLNLGLARLALGDARAASDHLAVGLGNLPADQQRAEWAREYRAAQAEAAAAA
ncbi:helix-turn-helix domain-containing protein [Streptomyces purpureus]|uniref:helix-turn-helix domain-containing protein n=1 Tax=Streptomyces purpureus TaxID=1951 RepID=UPI00379EF325